MYTGSLPATSIYGTWVENVEISSADDDTLVDLSSLAEITLKLRDSIGNDTLKLTMTGGDITLPAPGVIEWRVAAGQMGTLLPKMYEVVLLLDTGDEIVPLILGPVSVMS